MAVDHPQYALYLADKASHPDRVYMSMSGEFTIRVCRQDVGIWNGYVVYPAGYRVLSNEEIEGIHVHGGITYGTPVCVGFDTCHVGDFSPLWGFPQVGAIFRDFDYVMNQCINLCDQLKNLR
jgi:hypothetical protein